MLWAMLVWEITKLVSGSIKYFTRWGEVPTPQAGVVRPYEYAVDVAYSRLLSERFSAAVALRYMYSDLTGPLYRRRHPWFCFCSRRCNVLEQLYFSSVDVSVH